MRVALAALACSLFPAAGWAGGPPAAAPSSPVIGGEDAKPGKWPDVVAVLFPDDTGGDEALCTGTLVAPTVVLTAAHCLDPLDPPAPDNVLIGTSSLARPGEGEIIAIKDSFLYPDPETTEDLAVLVLDHASSRTPRKVVDGWARFDLVDGATVELVGFGAIDQDGVEFIDELQEASSKITDADCTRSMGCNAEAQPAGELGAGGMGIDTCSGDSGGPLYLMASYGPVLAGVTARSYDNAPVMCSDGGIYVRPDKVLDWIEMVAGVRIARFPGPTAEPITAVRGTGGDTRILVNDPSSDAHRFEVTTPPAHAMTNIRASDGAVRVCIDPAAPASDDQMTVMVTDTRHTGRALSVVIPIHIQDGTPAAMCDLDAFPPESGGCCDAGGHPGGALPLAIGVLALVRRRRRSAAIPR